VKLTGDAFAMRDASQDLSEMGAHPDTYGRHSDWWLDHNTPGGPIHMRLDRLPGREGKHRAIRNHTFVQRHGDDKWGCGKPEPDELDVICGYYREHHPTMRLQGDASSAR